ncbi:2-oxo acid dehydrogenase subunit E2 [Neorhizobium sp. P12A]|uniref:dihydrolipoamide acetyltransferase family protein n=1 Tax=Neorhizobium sp. P12A TaxID=2268027 RepID=UPI0011EECB63|nr:dihydrolipoamide acetyltransferase family protein [Neorhizobium sp. P12A]KAA0693683.1 2-oxo acid dehydrogenase subunit E2 [Neorhizobium sp. P12A]
MEFVVKMPDVGEGVAEAELVEWSVKLGDIVREDAIVAAVMTDKATVEIPSPVTGSVTWLAGDIGDKIAVKAPLLKIEVAGTATAEPAAETNDSDARAELSTNGPVASADADIHPAPEPAPRPQVREAEPVERRPPAGSVTRPLASPAVRRRALEAGVDLRQIRGTGPAGRISHEDLDRHLQADHAPASGQMQPARKSGVTEVKITGLRRRISEKMAVSASRIPHITYVEEIDMTALEELRSTLNRENKTANAKLTVLPFLMKAIARAVEDHPVVNALFDDERGVVMRHEAVHIGIATQTAAGLMVPVVRHVEARGLRDCADELASVAQAARDGSATRDMLTGSTITISSLGALGGLVSTPIINHPEVAIIGVNKLLVKPVWDGSQFVPRKCMNLSSSFDHRVVDGWDAAIFIQRVKALLETPAMIFLEG